MNINNEIWLIEDGILKEYRAIYNTPIDELIIPEGVREIADAVFENKYINKVVFPNSLEKIGDEAFRHTFLSEIILPDRVSYIGDLAFTDNFIQKIVFKGDNISIGEYVFHVSDNATMELSSKLIKQLINSGSIDVTHFGFSFKDNTRYIINCKGEEKDIVCNIIWYLFHYKITNNITLKNIEEKDIDFYLSKIEGKYANKTIVFETNSKIKEDKIVYHFGYDYNDNTVLKKCNSIREVIILPDSIERIDSYAFKNCYAKTLILPQKLGISSLCNSNIENIAIYANGNEFSFFDFDKLKSIIFLSSDSPTLNVSLIPDRDFDIYMPCGTCFTFTPPYHIDNLSKLKIHIDFSNCNDYDSFVKCISNINKYIEGTEIYCYNVSPFWLIKYKAKESKFLHNYIFYEGKKSFAEYFNISNKENMVNSESENKYSSLIQERIDKIKSLIEPINDDEEDSIKKLLDNLLEDYEKNRENFKPLYGSDNNFNLSVGPQSIRDLDINLMSKLDIIINKLMGNASNISLLKKLDEYVKKMSENNIIFDASENLTTFSKFNNILWYNSLIKDSKQKDKFKDELLNILKSISTSVSSELKLTIEESISLTTQYIDYNALLDEKIDRLYNKVLKCIWLLDSILNKNDSILAKSINNTRTLISLLDENSKQRLSKEFEEAIERIKNIDLSLSKEEIIEYADILLKPIREELDKDAYFSIRLKRLIDGINISLELLKTGEAVYQDTDIITDTVNEILSITPEDITESVKSDLLRVITNWDNKLNNRDFNVSPNFNNMNGYNKSLLDTIEKYKLMFGEHNSSYIKVFKIMEEKAREGFVEVSISKDEIKHIELLALYLTILKDLYTIKYKVECYVKEKEQYERQFVR